VPPIVLLAATLVGYAIRERSPDFALGAALTLNLAATAGFLLAGRPGGLAFDAALAARVALLNAVVGSVAALAWLAALAAERGRGGLGGPAGEDARLTLLVALDLALGLIPLALVTFGLFLDPTSMALPRAIAGSWGCAALGLLAGLIVARAR